MKRVELIAEVKKYFNIQELVCQHTYNKWKEQSWNFLDDRLLHLLLILRTEVLRVPLVCNVPSHGRYERGLRCGLCNIVQNEQSKRLPKGEPYLSQHLFGKAVDLTPIGMSAEDARQRIKACKNHFPFPIRMESKVSWLHIDVMDNGNGSTITEF